jgi:effector-binding domain-containing protein
MEHEVHVIDRPALRVVAKRLPVAIESIGETLAQAFGEVYAVIGAAEEAAAGPPFVIYHSMPVPGQPLDIEICAPVAGPLEPRDPWRLADLPAGTFASRTHVGPYDTVGATYDALSAWIPANGFAIAGPPREVYLSPPSTPPERIQTIVEFPVARVPVGVG